MMATSDALNGACVNNPTAPAPHFAAALEAEDLGDDDVTFFHLREFPIFEQTSVIDELPFVFAPTFEHFPPSLFAADTNALVLATEIRANVATRNTRMIFVVEFGI